MRRKKRLAAIEPRPRPYKAAWQYLLLPGHVLNDRSPKYHRRRQNADVSAGRER